MKPFKIQVIAIAIDLGIVVAVRSTIRKICSGVAVRSTIRKISSGAAVFIVIAVLTICIGPRICSIKISCQDFF